MKIRNSASEVAIARFRIVFFSKPRSSCQTWRIGQLRMRRRETRRPPAFVSGPEPSSAMQIVSGGTAWPATEVRHSVSARGFW